MNASARTLPVLLGALLLFAGCGPSSAPASAPAASSAAPGRSSSSSSQAASASPKTASASLIKVRSAYSAVTATQLPVYVAKDAGLFEREGLDVDLTFISSGPTLTAAMLSGDVPIADQGEDSLISADLNGADLVMVAAGPNRLLFSVYANPQIASIEALKGKKLGISKTGGSTDFAARYVLGRHNLQPQKDVTLLQIGGVPEILSAMKSGSIDAGVLSPPTMFRAPGQGMRLLADVSKEDLPYYQSTITVRKSWLSEHRDIAVRYVKAFNEAVALIRKDPATAKRILGKYTKQSDDAVLGQSVSALSAILPADQTPQLDAVKGGLDQAALTESKAKTADPAQFVDASIERQLGGGTR